MRGFRDAEGDILEFLKHKRKVDAEVVDLVWQVFCSDPYASLSSMAAQANAGYRGQKPLTEANVREALSQIGGYKVWRAMLKGLEKGIAHYKEEYLLEHLLHLLSEQSAAAAPVSIVPEEAVGDISALKGSPPQGESLGHSVKVPECVREQLVGLFSKAVNEASLAQQLAAAWQGTSGLIVLAFVLYSSGLSYAVIGGWLGVDASTLCRWLEPFASLGWLWLQHQRLCFSGQVAVDEKQIKIMGATWYLFVAVDCVTRFPLHITFYRSNREWYCRTF